MDTSRQSGQSSSSPTFPDVKVDGARIKVEIQDEIQILSAPQPDQPSFSMMSFVQLRNTVNELKTKRISDLESLVNMGEKVATLEKDLKSAIESKEEQCDEVEKLKQELDSERQILREEATQYQRLQLELEAANKKIEEQETNRLNAEAVHSLEKLALEAIASDAESKFRRSTQQLLEWEQKLAKTRRMVKAEFQLLLLPQQEINNEATGLLQKKLREVELQLHEKEKLLDQKGKEVDDLRAELEEMSALIPKRRNVLGRGSELPLKIPKRVTENKCGSPTTKCSRRFKKVSAN